MNKPKNTHSPLAPALLYAFLLASCTGLQAPKVETPHVYTLDTQTPLSKPQVKRGLVLAVAMPHAQPGFDTTRMAYLRKPHELNYFAVNRWADTPARMLDSLLIQALEQTTSFHAVIQSPSIVTANIRLDTELVRLQQNFETQPSQIQLTLRAQLIDVSSKRLLAVKVFDDIETAPSDDAYGGVVAANLVVQRVLGQLADFCVKESSNINDKSN
ncbi:hypothetical protein GALL_193810 [mine drainage metagenome]|uniref:ABC-type transport auxiliary lipoprotein component domain-containing protein n=1 Tax=mine drainage metagenome TaxID=410659 RepID=A0A1J5S2T8_9ZZZZ